MQQRPRCRARRRPVPAGGARATVREHATAGEPAGPNGRACIGVEAILAHITVDTARWSPTVHPFDESVAARLAYQTRYLDRQDLAAGLTVGRAVAATASAFGGVAEAIMARSRPRLDRAIARSRTAYSGLKKACHLHG